jgi:nicotinamide phosphoribosyltransferase
MMQQNGILSIVSDTYDVFAAAEKWNPSLVDMIRHKNGTLVFRPDSGEMDIVIKKLLPILERKFGVTLNSKGYKVLNNVKLLWGDGINEASVEIPFMVAEDMGFSADSIMTGSGGGLMSANIDRDTCKFAFKTSNITVWGEDEGICKSPITDPGKNSKRGRLMLIKENGKFITKRKFRGQSFAGDYLREIYRDGKLLIDDSWDKIKSRVE